MYGELGNLNIQGWMKETCSLLREFGDGQDGSHISKVLLK